MTAQIKSVILAFAFYITNLYLKKPSELEGCCLCFDCCDDNLEYEEQVDEKESSQ